MISTTADRFSLVPSALVLIVICSAFALAPIAVAAQATSTGNNFTFTVPKCPWVLTLKAEGFVVEQEKADTEGSRGYFLVSKKGDGTTFSLFVEPIGECKTSKECRDFVLKGGNPAWEDPINLVSSEFGNISYFEFLMPKFHGVRIDQEHVYAEFVEDGYWVDLHISKTAYKPADHIVLENIVKSAKFDLK